MPPYRPDVIRLVRPNTVFRDVSSTLFSTKVGQARLSEAVTADGLVLWSAERTTSKVYAISTWPSAVSVGRRLRYARPPRQAYARRHSQILLSVSVARRRRLLESLSM